MKKEKISTYMHIGSMLQKKIGLTVYQTIPTFNDPQQGGFCKALGKRRKCW